MSTDYYRAVTNLAVKKLIESASTRPWIDTIETSREQHQFDLIALDPIPYEAAPNLSFIELQATATVFPDSLPVGNPDGTINVNPREAIDDLSTAAAQHFGQQLGASGPVWVKGYTSVTLERVERNGAIIGYIVQFTRWGLADAEAIAGSIDELLVAAGAELPGEWVSEDDLGNMDDDFNLFDFLMEQ